MPTDRRLTQTVLACCLTAAFSPDIARAQGAITAGSGPLPPEALALPAHFGLLLGVDIRSAFASPEYKGLLRAR